MNILMLIHYHQLKPILYSDSFSFLPNSHFLVQDPRRVHHIAETDMPVSFISGPERREEARACVLSGFTVLKLSLCGPS